jgi:type IV pilus assembly protein PilY1
MGSGRRIGSRVLEPLVAITLVATGLVTSARALDIDIFTGTRVNPNVLIVFDNSGSMGSQAYNTYPNTIYTGSYQPGTIYTRCSNRNGVQGGYVNSNCTCRSTQSSWVVDESGCAATFVDAVPPPAGDDTDDRESRRKRGNRRNFETNAPKNCSQSPFQSCNTGSDCPGLGNVCSSQNKLAVAQGVVTSLVNDPDNADLRLGLEVFNPPGIDYNNPNYGSSTWVTGWQVNNNVYRFPVQDMTDASRATLTNVIGGLTANGATPTAHRLVDAWKYFNGQATASGFGTSPVQQTCQRNYVLMVTDGIPEVEADWLVSPASSCQFSRLKSFVGNPGDLNGDGKEDPASSNYLATTGQMYNCGSDYLDDAMYKIRGLFPLGNSENQPLNLYAVSFGFDFCQAPAAGDTSPGAGSLLWRASKKYGGGDCLAATEPDELDEALREAFNLIKNDAQSFVAPVVPVSQTNRTESGDHLYVALFAPREGQREWPGNVKKYALDRDHGTICNASTPTCTSGGGSATTDDGTILATGESFWDSATGGPSGSSVSAGGVGAVLKASNLSLRQIYTYTGTSTGGLGGVALTASQSAFSKGNTAITPAMLGLTGPDATPANRDALIDYVYGVDSYDANQNGNVTEKRSWILGDIIHSVPLIVNYDPAGGNALIIVGANDGMLHAFDDATGAEQWAFVPPDVLPNLNLLRPGEAAAHPFFVDASPKLKQLDNGQKILVFGLGRGGRAYYGLDITNKTAPTLLWRINETTTGFSELGMTTSTPTLTSYANGGSPIDVAVFGAGYDPYFDDPGATAANSFGYGRSILMVNLTTGAKVAEATHAQMTYAVASDPLMFDVNGDGIFDRGYVGDLGGNLWRISDSFQATRLFQAPSGLRIFYQPDAVLNSGSVTVYFGTGDRSNPMEDNVINRFYAIRDDGTSNLGEGSLVDVTNRVVQPGSQGATDLAADIANAHGWYITLAGAGEKVLAPPTVYFNVAFATFTPSNEVCQAGGTARLYVLDPLLGGPTFDLASTTGGGLGGGESTGGGFGSGSGGELIAADRFAVVGSSIPTSLKVTFGNDEAKAYFGVTKGGGVALQPLNLPQIAANVVPLSWRQVW